MPQLPSNVNYGTVVGQFVASVSDTNDPGYEPDSKAMEGTIVFTPSVSLVRNVTADPNPVTIVKTAITGILDDEGYLCTNQRDPITNRLRRGLTLVANDDEDLEPKDWNWVVTYKFKLDGWDIAGPPQHGLDVHTDEEVDLTEAIPVTISNGQPIIRGPKGEKGDKGDKGDTGATPNIAVGNVVSVANPGDDAWLSQILKTGTASQQAIKDTMPTTFKGDKGDTGIGWNSTELGTQDLNNITTPGVYRLSNPSNATTERNYPQIFSGTTNGGNRTLLEVLMWGSAAPYVMQRITRIGYNGFPRLSATRTYLESGWTNWEFAPSQRVDNTAGRAIYAWDPTANREQLIYGDTGWRDVKAEWPLQNGWTSDGVWVRRIGSSVTFLFRMLSGSSATATQFLYPPNGWRFTSSIPFFISNPVIINDTTIRNIAINGSTGTMQGVTGWTTGDRVVPVRFETNDPWPTTLPGTAVGIIPNA